MQSYDNVVFGTAAEKAVERITRSIDPATPLSKRIRDVSKEFLGVPYQDALLPRRDEAEQLLVHRMGMDSVVLTETVLALANAPDKASFLENLRALRYHAGEVSWEKRNHYGIEWLTRNVAAGYLVDITPQERAGETSKDLNLIPNYQCLAEEGKGPTVLPYLAVSELASLMDGLQDGDILFIGTTHPHLDVKTFAPLMVNHGQICLRHTSKGLGSTKDEPLPKFWERFGECPGVFLARPVDRLLAS